MGSHSERHHEDLKNIESPPGTGITSEEYMMLYATIYNMCTQKPSHNYSQQLYDKYGETLEEYTKSTVRRELSAELKDAVTSLTDREGKDEETDRALLDSVRAAFAEAGLELE